MSRHSAHVIRHVTAMIAALIALLGLAATASAGGWAVGSIDAIPDARAGETADVGFTILQHGATPADLSEDVGIEIVQPDGTIDFFVGTSDGAPGHYVAAVRFPAAGTYTWGVRMGWFGTQDLGTLDVLPTGHTVGAGTETPVWSITRWLMVIATAALATLAIADHTVSRRRARVLSS
jgi:hypothetical protein